MNPIYNYIIVERVKRQLKRKKGSATPQDIAKAVQKKQVEVSHIFKDAFMVLIGVLAATFGLKGFLLPNSFIDGGVTGISLILAELTGYSLAIYIVVINAPFILMAFTTVSRQFSIRSLLAIILLALAVHFIAVPVITEDKLLIAVFGGFFLGLGIGLAIRGGSVIDGTEVLAVYISRKTSLTIGDVILIFNIIIFLVAMYVFTIEIALYAMLTYLAASKTVDFVVSGIEEYIGVTIISDMSEEVRVMIIEKLGRACTIYHGKGGYTRKGSELKNMNIIYAVITRLELSKLQTEVDKIDKKAFIVMHSIKDARGGMIKKRPMK